MELPPCSLRKQFFEAELQQPCCKPMKDNTLCSDGRKAVVRNGHLPERSIQTGIGDVAHQSAQSA
ncbi:hypothetical protein OURE66S_03096 [Oligella ureolytica]